ncbi:MAG TPA: B12-binding domain-containing protein [Streptosporangiaceae bacterium]|nr:B12-binding domain-containing protein [Streptosporangiaceae bacterium]
MRLQEAADMLGVHYQTAYGWVRDGQLPARKIRRGYEVSDADVQALAARRQRGREPAAQIKVRDWPAQADRLYSAISDGEETRARRSTDRLAGHVSVLDLCDRVIAPALRRIGEDWAAGHVSIAEEHRATAICERLLATHATQPAGRPRGTAVVTTPPGERHGMPALMAAACLREARWHVHHLSADLPAAEIGRLAAEVGASLVVLSTATRAGAASADETAPLVRAAAPGATVLVGHAGENLETLLHLAQRAPADPSADPPAGA